jgi:F420-0:gamma-glutamyl ligase
MEIRPIKLRALVPPKDDLLASILDSELSPKDGDILAISSKVVSIHEGRCVLSASIKKEDLIKEEFQLFYTSSHTAR